MARFFFFGIEQRLGALFSPARSAGWWMALVWFKKTDVWVT
jgi:hypothetical protein